MSCFYPLTGYQSKAGSPLSFKLPAGRAKVLLVPCGQCHGCRLDRAASWGVRCVHEASLYDDNQFVTLTYAVSPGTLVPKDLQLFFKNLRHIQRFRFLACGEYGDDNGRPHYHALLFDFPCRDRYYWRKSASGLPLYRSPALEQVWRHGHVEIGDVTFASASYVARYAMKKVMGKDAKKVIFDPVTGLVREPEFLRMSLRPGIGALWYEKFWKDVYPHGYVVNGGRKAKPPKYYDRKFQLQFPAEYDRLLLERMKKAALQYDDNSPRRLRDKEIVSKAKVKLLTRSV